MIVAIDGPAGSGKSTVARAVARSRGLTYLDTGAMYRSVTLACLERGCDLSDAAAVAAVAREVAIAFETGEDGAQRVLLDGRDVSALIREARVDRAVSQVSAVPEVREAMVAQQRRLAAAGDVVAEGRDIGTVVFPDAEVKVFLTADARARAHRRAVQREGGDAARADVATDAGEERRILEDLERRDRLDSTREVAPLAAAPDATVVDSSALGVDEVCAAIERLMDEAAAKPAATATPAAAKAKPATTAKQDAPRAAAKPRAKRGPEPMRAFGNPIESYHEHQIPEFPLLARAFRWVAIAVVAVFSKLMWRWHVDGRERLREATRDHGVVLVMNHVSMLDPIVGYLTMVGMGRRIRPIYKSEFNAAGPLGRIISWVGGIPVQRGTADLKALRNAQRTLEAGDSIMVFPEGTRIKSDDQPVELHGGFAIMARMGKAKVVPMAIVGARDITPKGHHLPRPVKVWCRVGEPISFEELGVKGRKQQAEEMERVAMERVYALRDELRRDHPGKL